ncbi:GGDEF domain-containing protein [Aquirhabdus parva]|uniref:diguanylate cyclase n=1 Tax=Aquirhabdus parva TaxID=2283318 RepID=A0A345P7L8_9GAMM|nr:diguanylate cyclase [Aquirhabdus parva]AXI03277.1 GGDEF domain-containing protein [Aquirhabdus parva]
MKLNDTDVLTLEHEKITKLLHSRKYFLRFPHKLEKEYRYHYQNEAAREFRTRGVIIFLLYVLLSLGIYQLLPASQVWNWFVLYSWVGSCVFVGWVLSLFKRFSQWFDVYTCVCCSLAIAITFVITVVLASGESSILYHAAMMYAVVIVYGFVGMRFYTATLAGWSGGLLGILVTHYIKHPIDWTILHRTYTFSSFLGMSLVFATDHRHRQNYLQGLLNAVQAKQLEVLSHQDVLTGLANRRYLDMVMQREWDRAMRHQTPLAIMMVDVDFFKNYNDHLGHIEGDYCLKLIADGIAKIATRSDDFVARYGGEEFFLLFAMTEEAQAILQAKRLLEVINDLAIPHPVSTISKSVTISIGLASTVPQMGQRPVDFIKKVDQALYKAKSQGRNGFVVAEI